MLIRLLFFVVSATFFYSCSPLKSSANEEKHQMELTIHEMQTNMDDLRHDFNCYQTELNILDGKIKHHETALSFLKQEQVEQQEVKLSNLSEQLTLFEKKLHGLEKSSTNEITNIKKLASHSSEVTSALTQYKERIIELEKEILSQNHRLEELSKIKGTLELVARNLKNERPSYSKLKNYNVKAGDSLEKISKKYDSSVQELKEINGLNDDMIVIGQELKIPVH